MQFGKAEQDAFILDFNPTGGRLPLAWQSSRACMPPIGLSRAALGRASLHGAGGAARRCSPGVVAQVLEPRCCRPAATPAPLLHLALTLPSWLASAPAVLTAFQAFAIVLSTFGG